MSPVSNWPISFMNRILQLVKSWVESFRRDLALFSVGEIARRYFVMNAFDGALTILGIVVGFAVSSTFFCSFGGKVPLVLPISIL